MQAANNMSLYCVRCHELAKLKFLLEPSLSFHGVRRLAGGATASYGGIVNVQQDAEDLIEKAKAKLTSRKRRKPTTNDTSQKVTIFFFFAFHCLKPRKKNHFSMEFQSSLTLVVVKS